MSIFNDIFWAIFSIIKWSLIVLFAIIFISTICHLLEWPSCDINGKEFGLKTKWSFQSGCVYTLKDGRELYEYDFEKHYVITDDEKK
jgi:hypothetical protein